MADLRTWVAGARPRTLPAAIVPVVVGTACAAGVAPLAGALKGISLWRLGAALVVALAIQIGTNYANDYSDGKRGTDDPGARTGPPRLVGWGLAPARQVRMASFASFGVAAVAGLALAIAVSWWLVPLGAVCFAAGWLYTGGPRPYGYAGFGEVFVFVFFGLVATMGSAFVQTGYLFSPRVSYDATRVPLAEVRLLPEVIHEPPALSFPWLTFGAAVAVGALATALLVINNLRDIPSDTVAGKRTLAVRIGDRRTRTLYLTLVAVPLVVVPVLALAGGRTWALLALGSAVPAAPPVRAVTAGAKGRELVPVLGQTGRFQLVFGLLLAAGLFASA